MKRNFVASIAFIFSVFHLNFILAEVHNGEEVDGFIMEMVDKHGFDRGQLESLFEEAALSNTILETISRPAEALPWYRYRKIFLRNDRIQLGKKYLDENREILESASREYGVPPEIITAIIGVETRYGNNTGSFRVLDSLVTLGFGYPRRASFFRKELEQFLLLSREQGMDPLSIKGSYAGAMGIPQFISSSFRHYAVDFDGDGKIDIWNNTADAIGSVANYFSVHGWNTGGQVAVRTSVSGDNFNHLIDGSLAPERTLEDLSNSGVNIPEHVPATTNVTLLEYELENGNEYWVGFKNFYVITRYNHSPLYAMAVYQLAREISGNSEY
jgi:membrane-bound lytic murein transglycosylase B